LAVGGRNATRRSRIVAAAALSAAAVTVVAAAITASGFAVDHVAANDGAVWVTDNAQGDFGRFDYPIAELDAAFGPPGQLQSAYDLDVLQNGTTVLAIDRARADLYAVDVEAGTVVTPGVALPGGAGAQVALGGSVAAVLDPASGKVWAAVVGSGADASLSGLATTGTPLVKVAGASAVAVGQDGTVYVASPHQLVTIPYEAGTLGPAQTTPLNAGLGSPLALTAVGGTPVILDAAHERVLIPTTGQSVTIPDASSSLPDELQQAGPASTSVLVATTSTLYALPLAGGKAQTIVGGGHGSPAQPVVLGQCVHAAWAGAPAVYARFCNGSGTYHADLPGSAASTLVFRVNNDQILLNDLTDGSIWSVNGAPAMALNAGDWQRLLSSSQHLNQTTTQTPEANAASQGPPKAVDEQLSARAGRTSVLHILDGDSDPDGSVLSIASVSPPAGNGFTVQIAPNMQTVAVAVTAGDAAPITFQYTIIDARGQSATATVTVSPATTETPPHLRSGFTSSVHEVASGATAAYQVLGDWRDAESDPLSVTDATVPAGQVTWTSGGLITYSAPVVAADTAVTVTYDVTDGLSAPVTGQLQFHVLGRGDTTPYPATALPDSAQVLVGEGAVVSPLLSDIPGADPLHPDAQLTLAGPVAAPTGLTVSTDVATGELTITAQQTGVYSLTYQAAFGSAPLAEGPILIVARAPAGSPQEPVTTPEAVLLRGQLPTTVDVLAEDYDPSGDLLTLVGAIAPSGLQATVVDGEWLRLVATSPTLSGQQIVQYQVTDGVTDPVDGQVTVTWLPQLPPTPPVAPTVYATVQAGDETDVPVLQADTDPSGEPMTLVPGQVTISPTGSGAASIDAGDLRYAAPPPSSVASAEQVTVSYIVEDASGESSTGQVVLTVNPKPADAAHAAAPVPAEVDARVVAGGTVIIPIPTTGVDPDGESIAVTGIVNAPQLGRVVAVGQDSITYQAYPLSAGTDSLGYQVENGYSLIGQSIVRIAITSPAEAPAPIAVADNVIAAPGSTVLVDVLGSAIIAPGDKVTVEPLSKTNASVPAGARLVGGDLQLTAPSGAQPLVVTFGITDGSSPASLAQVTLRSQPGYVTPPVAVDDYPAAPTAGKTSITVDVLANDYDPAGSSGDLTVSQVFEPDVRISANRLVIPVLAAPRAVAYQVTNPGKGTAVAVVHVPGTSTGPQLKAGATIQVPNAGVATVDINKYITDSRGAVRLLSSSGVSVAPASDLSWKPVSYTSLTLTGTAGYAGPAALTVDVTDGTSASDPQGRTAVLSIPVQVGPPTPVLRCPTTPISLIEGAAPVDLSLASVCAVWTPTTNGAASLSFTAHWTAQPANVSFSWGDATHQVLVVTSGSAAQPGSTGKITLGVSGSTATAVLSVDVVAAPPASVAAVTVPGVETGHTASVDLRQYVTSPLADPTIEVVGLQPTSPGSAVTSYSGSLVQITPQSGTHGSLTFTVDVTDLPGRADRTVTGQITLQVLDAPGAPGALQGVPGNQQVALSWGAAPDNGSPVDYYVVSVAGGGSTQVPGTSHLWTGLTNGTSYQFTVQAHNQVGLSTSSVTASFTPQSAPGAPGPVTATPGDGEVTLSWGAANANGQPLDSYILTVNPAPASGSATATVPGTGTSYTWSGLSNNVGPYTFAVTAHNALGSGPSSQSSAVYAHGQPLAPAAPTASGAVSPDQTTTTITVSWPAVSACNDAQPCASYTVTELRNGTATATTTSTQTCSGSQSICATFGPLTNDGSAYTYEVQDTNREGQTSATSPPSAPAIDADGVPGQITNLGISAGNQALQASFTLPASHGASLTSVKYTATNTSGGSSASGSWSGPGSSGQSVNETISGLVNGDTYTVTVVACNEAGNCGTASNSASSFPYGPPNPPSVSASASGNSINFNWSGGGGNGQPVSYYYVCTTNGCGQQSASASPMTVGYACNTTESFSAYVVDAVGQHSSTATSNLATTAPCAPPPQSVTVSEGGAQYTPPYCPSSPCRAVDVTLNNFSPNTEYTIWYSTDCAGWGASCTSGGTTNYVSASTKTDGSGNATFDSVSFGFPGANLWVNVGAKSPNGVPSNTLPWK
jgi:hypothetical protein